MAATMGHNLPVVVRDCRGVLQPSSPAAQAGCASYEPGREGGRGDGGREGGREGCREGGRAQLACSCERLPWSSPTFTPSSPSRMCIL